MTPEPYPLTNAYFKTERAKVHLEELKIAIEAFAKSKPYTLTSHEEPGEDAIRYRVEIQHPHVSIFLIAADVLQCLRTALDQAVWSIASLKYPDPDWTQFPVFAEPLNAKTRKRFDGQVFGIPDKAIKFIESLQPYNRPAGTPLASSQLWQLHELNRIDKHRRILVRTMITGISRSAFGVSVRSDFALFRTEVRDYGCDIFCGGSYKHLPPTLTPIVVFGEQKSGISIPLSGLDQIYQFVTDDVLPTLAGLAK